MRKRFYIEIAEMPFSRLQQLAEAERRDVRDQAAVLLERALLRSSSRSVDGQAVPTLVGPRGLQAGERVGAAPSL